MIEVLLYDFLTEKMTVPVYVEKPKNPSETMIIIEKTGSSEKEFIKTSTFAVQSYGSSLFEAAELNENVKNVIFDGIDGLISLDEVIRVDLNSDYNFTDTTEKRNRYQAVIVITHY